MTPEAQSLLGKPLYPPDFSPDEKRTLVDNLERALEAYRKSPDDPDALIWVGRRTAYLWQYRKAIETFSEGIARYPNNHRFYRHRGHRYISIRQFDKAIADLDHASQLIAGIPDEIEPDGIPNKLNQPTSTSHFNIWYHLGLAYYLTEQYGKAAEAYNNCLKFCNNDDATCATVDWLYMTYRRAGQNQEAESLLQTIHSGMTIIENTSYFRRLLMYKGELTPQALLDLDQMDEREKALSLATQGYGVANWYLYNGDTTTAVDIYQQVLEGTYWAAFGYIAAEVDVWRLNT